MLSKQFQGSKKKARKKSYWKRKIERMNNKIRITAIEDAENIEEIAKAMGIRLR